MGGDPCVAWDCGLRGDFPRHREQPTHPALCGLAEARGVSRQFGENPKDKQMEMLLPDSPTRDLCAAKWKKLFLGDPSSARWAPGTSRSQAKATPVLTTVSPARFSPPQAFSVIAMFNVMKFSIAILPFSVKAAAEASVSLRRMKV